MVGNYLEQQARQAKQQPRTPTNAKVGALQTQASQSRARLSQQTEEIFANWGQDNTIFTKARYEEAGRTLRAKNSYALLPGVVPPEALAALSVRAGFHVEAGVRGFKDFARVMKAEAESAGISWSSIRPRLEGVYRDAMAKVGLPVNEQQINSVNKEFVKEGLTEARPLSRFTDIAAFRRRKALPEYDYHTATGTVAFTEYRGTKIFDTSPIIGRGRGIYDQAIREQAFGEIQTKLGKLQGETYGRDGAQFLLHAEAGVLIQAATKFKGQPPKELTIYVDRITCEPCREGLHLLVELYGMEKVTIRDSHGHIIEVDPTLPKGYRKLQ